MSDKITTQEMYRFSASVLHLLHAKGYFVTSLEEAFYCISGMVDKQIAEEINEAMGRYPCQSCHRTSGSKNIDQIN